MADRTLGMIASIFARFFSFGEGGRFAVVAPGARRPCCLLSALRCRQELLHAILVHTSLVHVPTNSISCFPQPSDQPACSVLIRSHRRHPRESRPTHPSTFFLEVARRPRRMSLPPPHHFIICRSVCSRRPRGRSRPSPTREGHRAALFNDALWSVRSFRGSSVDECLRHESPSSCR